MPKMPPGNKAKNPGSPLAAYERYTSKAQNQKRVLKKAAPKVNPGSPTAAAERQARSRAAGSPTAAAERAGSRGRTAANTGRPKVNPGSPTDAAQRSVRTLYGRAVASSSRDASTKNRVTALQNASGRGGSEGPKRGMTAGRAMGAGAGSEGPKKQAPKYGPTGGAQPRPTRGPGRGAKDVIKPKTDQQLIAEQRTLRAKLKGVDYEALGRLMNAEGYGAYGRKAANKGKPTLPKTK